MSNPDESPLAEQSYPRNIVALRLTHEEARTVLDHQIDVLGDIDDKAARTVRVTALLLGAVVSTLSLLGNSEPFINQGTAWGTVSLVLSIVLGTFTYGVSSPDLGASPKDIKCVLDRNYREDEWLTILLHSYETWIDRTNRLNRFNSLYLSLTQASLGIGLISLTVGVLDGLEASVSPLTISLYSVPAQLIVAVALLGLLVAYFQ